MREQRSMQLGKSNGGHRSKEEYSLQLGEGEDGCERMNAEAGWM